MRKYYLKKTFFLIQVYLGHQDHFLFQLFFAFLYLEVKREIEKSTKLQNKEL